MFSKRPTFERINASANRSGGGASFRVEHGADRVVVQPSAPCDWRFVGLLLVVFGSLIAFYLAIFYANNKAWQNLVFLSLFGTVAIGLLSGHVYMQDREKRRGSLLEFNYRTQVASLPRIRVEVKRSEIVRVEEVIFRWENDSSSDSQYTMQTHVRLVVRNSDGTEVPHTLVTAPFFAKSLVRDLSKVLSIPILVVRLEANREQLQRS